MASTNPGVVYCSITGFGSHAGAELPGYDLPVHDYLAPPRLGEHNNEIRRWLTTEHTS